MIAEQSPTPSVPMKRLIGDTDCWTIGIRVTRLSHWPRSLVIKTMHTIDALIELRTTPSISPLFEVIRFRFLLFTGKLCVFLTFFRFSRAKNRIFIFVRFHNMHSREASLSQTTEGPSDRISRTTGLCRRGRCGQF